MSERADIPDPVSQAETVVGQSPDNPWTMPEIVQELLPTPSPEEQAERVFDLTRTAIEQDGAVDHHAGRTILTHPSMRPEYRQRILDDNA